MKPFLFVLLLPTSLFAQNDSIAEDQILQKIELGDPSEASIRQLQFLKQPSVPYAYVQKKGCIYYLDSLYSGVILEPIYDSLYTLWGCKGGYLTGEKLVRQRFRRDTAFCTVYYSQEAVSDSAWTSDFIRYYPNGRVKETGTTYKKNCLGYESYSGAFFGRGDADGIFCHYYKNGQLETSCTIRFRTLDGDYLEYYANGQLKEQRFYELGKPVGKWRQYSETGKKTGKLTFRNARPKGRWNSKRCRNEDFREGQPL